MALEERMAESARLNDSEWRIFQLFLVDLEDSELDHVQRQLQRELAARHDRETDSARLFFTSLQLTDLGLANQAIRTERRARVQDRRILEQSAVPKRSRQLARL
jgi:hypothetical protein